jgi:hypothetical protein
MKLESVVLILFVFVLLEVWAIKVKQAMAQLVTSHSFHFETTK